MTQSSELISRKDLVRLLSVVVSNWYWLIILPLVSFALSYLYTHRLPDIHAAKCQILLKSNETYNYQSEIYKGLGFNSRYATYEETASQMRVIKSSGLIEQVLERLPLDVSYFIVGRLKVSEVYKHMPFRVETDQRSSSFSGVVFDLNIVDTNMYTLSYSFNGELKKGNYRFGELILDNGLFLKIHREQNLTSISLPSLSQIDYQFKVHRTPALIQKYQSSINVSNLDYTSIVEVTLRDEIPERAVEVLDTLANIYIVSTLANKRHINENTLSYIDIQLNEVIGIINEIENELEDYKQDASILNLSREEETYFNRLIELDVEKREFQDQVSALEDLTTYLLKEEDVESLLPPNLFVANTDPELARQVKELYEARGEYGELLNSNTSQSPRALTLLDKIRAMKVDIIRYIDSQKTAVQTAMNDLESKISALEGRIKNIPKTQRQILNIERRLAVNEELYSFLLSKRAETIIARAGIVPETKIIEQSRPVGVVYPDKFRLNLIGCIVGLGLAVLIVVLKEVFFQRIKNLGQLQSLTELSILGSIPRQKDLNRTFRLLSGNERSPISQAFRALRTNLQFLIQDANSNVILVTSLLPGEGKTFTSVNLASVLAIAEKKVLIMDFDLHKPRLAKAMELPNEKGISSLLNGSEMIENVIQKTEVPTLDVITSGPIPPNASELIMREKLNLIIEYARKNYEFIFFDTPPVSLISDALILTKTSDVNLFVLNSKSTSKTSLDYIDKILTSNSINAAALVLNQEEVSRLDYYYARYGYGGYGYGGYGYGGYGGGGEYK